jgi:hypothetical protein
VSLKRSRENSSFSTFCSFVQYHRSCAKQWDEPPIWWDAVSGRRLPAFSGLPQRIHCAAFSPDSALLALGDSKGVLHLRETATGREVRQLKVGSEAAVLAEVAFSPNGQMLAFGCANGSLTLWDRNINRPRRRLSGPRQKYSWKLAFSFDSRLLAVARHDEHRIHLYETASGQELPSLHPNTVSIGSLAFAPDNRTLAVGDATTKNASDNVSESAIRLWDVPERKPICVMRGHRGDVHTLAFSPDGAFLISGSEDDTVLSWDVAAVMRRRPTGKELSTAHLAELWSALAAADAVRAQGAVAGLIQAPDAALPFLEKSLPPVVPAKMAYISALITDLDCERFVRRDKASKELEKIGEDATPALRKALKDKPSLEMRKRIAAILETIEQRPPSAEGLRTVRVLQVLECIGTPRARQILEGLALGASGASLTAEAKATLQRLTRRFAKP